MKCGSKISGVEGKDFVGYYIIPSDGIQVWFRILGITRHEIEISLRGFGVWRYSTVVDGSLSNCIFFPRSGITFPRLTKDIETR